MPDTTIIKLKIRRGTDAQRKLVVLEQGELGYAIDSKRVFVGDGATYGGIPAGSVVHEPRISGGAGRLGLTTAVKGDIVYDTNLVWQLTGSNYNSLMDWVNIGTKGDTTLITYDNYNRLTINTRGLSSVITSLSATFESPTFTVSNNTVILNPISSNKISKGALGKGLKGGDSTPLYVNANTSQFGFEVGTNALTLTALPASSVTYSTINPSIVGAGLSATSSNIVASLRSVDNTTIQVNNGQISLPVINSGGSTFLRAATFDTYGRITSVNYAATDTLSGFNTLTNALTVFNGSPNQISSGKKFTNQTLVTAVSTLNGTTCNIVLTSAGFMTFAATNSVSGTAVDRFALPIYSY